MHDLYYMERIKYNLYYRLSKYTKEVSKTSMFVFTFRLEFVCVFTCVMVVTPQTP